MGDKEGKQNYIVDILGRGSFLETNWKWRIQFSCSV